MTTVTMRRLMIAILGVTLGLGAAGCSDDANVDVPAVDTVEESVTSGSSETSGSPDSSVEPAPEPGQPGDTTVDTGTPGGDPGTGGGGSATSTGASVSP